MVMSGGDAMAPAAFVTREALGSKVTCVVSSSQSGLGIMSIELAIVIMIVDVGVLRHPRDTREVTRVYWNA